MFAIFFTPVLIKLGYWQLDRAAEKERLIAQIESRTAMEPQDLPPPDTLSPPDQWQAHPVYLSGRFEPMRYLLLDNQIRDGKAGYDILHLFTLTNGLKVLVNRGWVAAPTYRKDLPEIFTPQNSVEVYGSLHQYHAPPLQFAATEAKDTGRRWPKRVQEINLAQLEQDMEIRLYPLIVRLKDNQQPGALQTGWHVNHVSPAKHRGYAFQWFALAVTLITLTLLALIKTNREHPEGVPSHD
ncbi:cytochrome oxidase assembly protein Surf1 [Oleiphilus messinensis]|uniref:SURF1-like protein n=1 Tax=Oleiphilus messinensis TaxID=141451 RepID=A0A1Y0I9Z1_9GAMM|nr:SURF1 family protein [Oleiphilus messinensis]ARU57281.1 cytochrome oxidase assembly protein Surf1 [Oleiphilus messinensis]